MKTLFRLLVVLWLLLMTLTQRNTLDAQIYTTRHYLDGRAGGAARASPDERRKITLKANRARWHKQR